MTNLQGYVIDQISGHMRPPHETTASTFSDNVVVEHKPVSRMKVLLSPDPKLHYNVEDTAV